MKAHSNYHPSLSFVHIIGLLKKSVCRRGLRFSAAFCSGVLLLMLVRAVAVAESQPDADCPTLDWGGPGVRNTLGGYILPNAIFPTNDTAHLPTPDCNFHQWSWEAFVWATTPNSNGVLRFLTLPTPDDLTGPKGGEIAPRGHPLRLGLRTPSDYAGAIVEADGNMLVSQDGHPVYASVHMNQSYFTTAKSNLIVNGGYTSQPLDSYFSPGAAVFKATWLRVGPGQPAPAGAYTTKATVPLLTAVTNNFTNIVVTTSGKVTNVTVALVGLHVVGYTANHPEFLWGTFEHRLNAPMLADNTFTNTGVSTNNYTFYKAGTSFGAVNIANQGPPPSLTFHQKTSTFSPVTQAVQENRTGGENNSTNGPANIAVLNQSAHQFLVGLTNAQSVFANYNLIGTVWLKPNTYVASITNYSGLFTVGLCPLAVGSVNLANTTAETFVQVPSNSNPNTVQNCFLCHNPGSYTSTNSYSLPLRRIAISHVLSRGTNAAFYGVPNLIPVAKVAR
ncbi:MAG TPA: hypothetical protein VHH73_01315 [Verrucomicrobiae bacterium]|nr:hypothetical protein [Verrucomicrobiae bacterium]